MNTRERISDIMKKAVIFGSGQIGSMLNRLAGTDYHVICFADNAPQRQGSYLQGIPVLSVEKSLTKLPDCFILGVLDEERSCQMETQLLGLRFTGEILRPNMLETFDTRIGVLRLLAEQIKERNVPGDVAEVGVYRGDFAAMIHHAFRTRTLHLFDTFTGFPAQDVRIERENGLSRAKAGDFSETDPDMVIQKMLCPEHLVLHKGYFPETFSPCENTAFAFVSLDVDLYAPTKAALTLFWPRMSPGGCIMVHDYNSTQFSGAGKAVREFCKQEKVYPVPICDLHGSVVLMKQ